MNGRKRRVPNFLETIIDAIGEEFFALFLIVLAGLAAIALFLLIG